LPTFDLEAKATRPPESNTQYERQMTRFAVVLESKGKKAQLEGRAPSKHPKQLSTPKLKQEVATTNMDLNNRGGSKRNHPQQAPQKTPTSSPNQHQPPLKSNHHHHKTPPPYATNNISYFS